ncbi:MAG: histidine kinase [Bacteroidales bacterium]|jgi:sensor histidine kinase YesM|nr:histidine kinase [Bacteroidales bacterium]
MQNPFLNKNFLIVYSIACTAIAVVQFLILYLFAGLDLLSAILQAFFSNVTFAALGVGIWYIVRYKTPGRDRFQLMLRFFLTGFIVVAFWMIVNFIIGKLLHRVTYGTVSFQWHLLSQFILGFLFYVIFMLWFHLMIVISKYSEKTISEERLQNLLTETKLNALKAYINPHFLFNSLNSVNALIVSNPGKAREMVVNLSEYFRYSLKQKDNTYVNFEDELRNALTYLEIEKLRFGERISLNIDIDESSNGILVPVMTLQPLFENIVKHAVSESFDTIYIDLKALRKDDYLEIILTNNYDVTSVSTKGTGIGLSTNIERFSLIYHRKDLIEISKTNGIFKVFMKIPINLETNDENSNY